MKQIPLGPTHKVFALVDDEDFERLAARKWSLTNAKSSGSTHYTDTMYIQSHILGSIGGTERLQTEIWTHHFGPVGDGLCIDHRDNNSLNNQKSNLRLATRSQNCMNRRKTTKPCSSKYKGVHWDKRANRWVVVLTLDKKRYTKYCRTEDEAAIYYNEFAKEHFGEYAYLNVIKEVKLK